MDDDIDIQNEDIERPDDNGADDADAGAVGDMDDIDTPVDHALLYGGNDDDADAEALAAIAGTDGGEDAAAADAGKGAGKDAETGQQDDGADDGAAASEVAKPQLEIPSERVAQVITQIRDMHTHLGLQAPDFGDTAVAMSSEDFSNLVTLRNRMKIKVAASAVDLDEERKPADGADKADETQAIDLDAKEREYLDAQYNGDTDRAMELRREIRAEEIRLSEAAAARKALEVTSAQRSKTDVETIAQNAIKAYPFLNENNGDNPAMNEVVEWRDFYTSKGQSAAQALASAVKKIAPLYDKKPPAADTAAEKKGADAPATEDPRKAAAVARNIADAKAQPPVLDGVGSRVSPPLLDVKSQEDWERLPESERKRMMM